MRDNPHHSSRPEMGVVEVTSQTSPRPGRAADETADGASSDTRLASRGPSERRTVSLHGDVASRGPSARRSVSARRAVPLHGDVASRGPSARRTVS